MPEERIYERQVTPREAAGLPMASPEAFGAGVGRAVADLGGELHRGQVQAYQIERQVRRGEERAEGFKRITAYKTNILREVNDLRAEPELGAEGHAQAVDALLNDAGHEALYEGITESSVRQEIQRELVSFAGGLRQSEAEFQTVKAAAATRDNTQVGLDRLVNLARTSADPRAFAQAHDTWAAYVGGITGLPADEIQKIHRVGDQQINLAQIDKTIDTDPVVAYGMLASGVFDDSLTPEQIEHRRSKAEVEIRARQVQAQREQAQQAKIVNEQIATLMERNSLGEQIPDGDFAQASAAAAALGNTSLAVKIDGIRDENRFARIWGNDNATPLQRQQRIAELARKDNRTGGEDRELAYLQKTTGATDSAYNADPVGAMARAGGVGAPPAIDPDNPGTWAARVKWQRETGATALFSDAEARVLQQELGANKQGEVGVLAKLDAIPGGYARAVAARQIAPNDSAFQQLAQMQPQVRGTVRAGRQAVAANKGFFSAPQKENPQIAVKLSKVDAELAFALRQIDPEFRQAALVNARYFVAGILSGRGQTDATELENSGGEGLYRQAMTIALGGAHVRGKGWVGGLSAWGEKAFVLPETMNMADFKRALFQDAVRKKGNPPVNPDGTPADLKGAYPVYLGGGRYRWESASGAIVKAKHGGNYITEVGP